MLKGLWVRFKNWVKQTRLYRWAFGAPHGEQQPLLQGEVPANEAQEPVVVVEPTVSPPGSPRHAPSQAVVLASAFAPLPEQSVERLPPLVEVPLNTHQCVLSHTQQNTIAILRQRGDTLFSRLPRDVMKLISRFTDAAYDKQSDISQLLHHVAWGNPDEVKKILDQNPGLLLEAGHTEDPAGNQIIRVTPFECALGAGDDDMAATISEYFAKLEGGEQERSRQYARYQHHIDNMLTKPAYDFSPLLQIIKESSIADVQAALNLQFNSALPLHAALDEFRSYFAPRQIKGGMHFNYQDLLRAFQVYADEFNSLCESGGNGYAKCDLFWRQVIGYIQRLLPACDRQAFAQGIYYIVEENEKKRRTFDFRMGGGSFPTRTDFDLHPATGLGFEYAWRAGSAAGARASRAVWPDGRARYWKSYVKQKRQACKTYAATPVGSESVRNLLK